MSLVNVVVTTTVVKPTPSRPGLCINTYSDGDYRRPPSSRPIKSVIADLNPGFVRINDGHNIDETGFLLKDDYTTPGAQVFCSGYDVYPSNAPDICKPIQSSASTIRTPLLLTDLVNMCPNGVPVLCGVPMGPIYMSLNGAAVNYIASKSELLAYSNAVVHYNKNANLGITHWEIGNETIGYPANPVGIAPNVEIYATDVQEFVNVIRLADPSVKIGINAMSSSQFSYLMEHVIDYDFLIPHNYAPYGNPNTYPQYASLGNAYALMSLTNFAIDGKRNANVSPEEKTRVQIITTEANAIDFSPFPYPRTNNLGLSIMLFDMLGQHTANVDVNGVTVWNTRGYVEGKDGLPHVLTPTNDLTPIGHSISLWSKNMPNDCNFISATRDLTGIFVYAAANANTTTLWLVNKKTTSVTANVVISNPLNCISNEIFTGTSYQDLTPVRYNGVLPQFSPFGGNVRANVVLLPTSINVLKFGEYIPSWNPTVNLTVSSVLTTKVQKPGLSMNAFMDSDLNRPSAVITFKDAVKSLSPAYLRYPGGQNVVGFSWASSPWTTPSAILTRVGPNDFPSNTAAFYTTPGIPGGNLINCIQYNEFVDICSYANVENITQVDVDSLFMTASGTNPTENEIISSARGLVAYASTISNVKSWELGWHPYIAGPTTYTTTIDKLSSNMKSIGAGAIACAGDSQIYWGSVLPNVNYIGVNNYPVNNFPSKVLTANTPTYTADNYYDYMSTNVVNYTSVLPLAKRNGKPVVVLETNVYDVSKNSGGPGWPLNNDVSRFLQTFDLLGYTLTSGVLYTGLWNTRSYQSSGLFDVFDANNNLLPTGWAMKAFTYGVDAIGGTGNFVSVNSSEPMVSIFAAKNGVSRVIWVSNKTRNQMPFRMVVENNKPIKSVRKYQGSAPTLQTITETILVPNFTQRFNWITGYLDSLSVYTIVF